MPKPRSVASRAVDERALERLELIRLVSVRIIAPAVSWVMFRRTWIDLS